MATSEPSSAAAQLAGPFREPPRTSPNLLRLWFGVSDRVGRRAYAGSGIGLTLLKYAVEAAVIYTFASEVLTPLQFLNPSLSIRVAMLKAAPPWTAWALFLWTLPFLWIAVSMSVRRAADGGLSPWMGMLVLVPLLNLFIMLMLCFVPSSPSDNWAVRSSPASGAHAVRSAILGVSASLLIGVVMVLTSIYLLASYGAALFVGTPVVMGAAASYIHNRAYSRGFASSALVGLAAVGFGLMALLLFAFEGVICIAMALPLLLPIGMFGGFIGKAIADATRRPLEELMAALIVLPLLAGAETLLQRSTEYEVLTAVEIDAPPETVWKHVVDFPELTQTPAWYFRWGIACPMRARIVGRGVGATRYCEFTTGTFVEPITAWEPPQRLAFDVVEQPAPMFELTPFRDVHPPHLDGYLRSNRGEFRLVALPGKRTRLEGRTWYEFDMFPQWYWTGWSDTLMHRIHERVLLHIRRLSESDGPRSA